MNEREKARIKIQQTIRESDYAQSLINHPDFKWYIARRQTKADALLKQLSSDDFINDHNAYLRVLGTYRALMDDTQELSHMASKGHKGRQDLELLDNDTHAQTP